MPGNKCPNPLFVKWLTEWRDEAKARGLKSHHTYNRALMSLKKYPDVLKSGREAKPLNFFGDKLCFKLDEKLREQGLLLDTGPTESQPVQSPGAAMTLGKDLVKKKKTPGQVTKKPKAYLPAPRTGPHALLITLYNALMEDELDHLKKSQLVQMAQPHCDVSFTLSERGTFYTAWNSMAQLVKKNLVTKEGNPARYSLTDTGKELAEKLTKSANSEDNTDTGAANRSKNKQGSRRQVNHVLSSSEDESSTLVEHTSQERRAPLSQIFTLNMNNLDSVHASSQHWESSQEDGPHFCLQPGSFSVVLCVDCAETTSGNARSRKANLLPELRIQNVPVDVRKLHVGDFVWVARENVRYQRGQSIAPPRELVFDFVVERKRIDDLSHSIMDGRFHEQKSRLKECGLRKPVYLVEEFKLHFLSVPRETLEQAISNTQFIDEFEVIRTNCLKETVQYLSLMTRYLQTTFENQTLYSRPRDMEDPPSSYHLVPFDIFNKGSIKNKPLTVQEMFCKQLCQLSGLSVEKVLAIAQIYPTPSSLFEAYMKCATEEEKEKLLVNIKYGSAQRNIGPVISKALCHLYAVPGPLH